MLVTGTAEPQETQSYKRHGSSWRFWNASSFVWKKIWSIFWFFKLGKIFFPSYGDRIVQEKFFRTLGEDCRDFFLSMGGVYIKLGQYLGNLSHIFPDSFTESLQDLQDRVPPHPFSEIEERFRSEFGKEIGKVFPDIRNVPEASASTAQVHVASIGGQKVAVKVLYPGIETLIENDLKNIRSFLKRINRYLFRFEYKKIHDEITHLITRETDLQLEADSYDRMRQLFAEEPDYVFPKVIRPFSGRSVLVTEFIEGVKITRAIPVLKGQAKSRPVELLVRAYVLMIFQYRFYHADPHPGNLIYTKDEKLCFIDFGAVGEMNVMKVFALKKIFLCAIAKDYYGVVSGLDDIGALSASADREKLEEVVRYSLEKLGRFVADTDYFRNLSLEQIHTREDRLFLKEINSSLKEIFRMIQIPENFIFLERVLGLLVGITAILDPYRTVLDYGEKPFRALAVGKEGGLEFPLLNEDKNLLSHALSIPGEFYKVLQNINRGRQGIQLREVERHTRKMYVLGHQFLYFGFLVVGIHFGNYYLERGMEIQSWGFFGTSGFFGLILIYSFWKNKLKKKGTPS
ncbi:ABC1 kinase family protein [Leptospira santarosai]|uniref:ABC1 kinase family protein n=1 Tax=Leptospira santarosai TaxID=28183 RepID=UPI0002974170|nr:AarF/UbiB family protein [Leptospira santarosai]EKS06686.1 ABC1 family protein [Leptospira santarosai str. JET]KXZ30573.1 protein kinase [Leptospira santarosai]MDI7197870.1 AarF/UbiB family protein [Leptospira santarosai]MDI7200096.1 AarF/UbiB family protein [Leptospira santarosai]MDI7204801.1 AarF/UbiB family protein [Leptospira santarosai]